MKCKVCDSEKLSLVFKSDSLVPEISNLVYENKIISKEAKTTKIKIYHCDSCDFVFDSIGKKLIFDEQYDNAQENSSAYKKYIDMVSGDIKKHILKSDKVVEVGCGNGFLVEKLNYLGVETYGFDPSYSGKNSNISNRYYNEQDTYINPSLIVMRHMLDYIEFPIDFLNTIAKMHNYSSKFYIEVPSYDYMQNNNYWIDFNGERYSYFSKRFFENIFTSPIIKETFDGQYLTVIADMKSIKDIKNIRVSASNDKFNFMKSFNISKSILSKLKNVALWGASGRGVMFSNLIDPKQDNIKCLVDINKNKIKKFIGGGFQIIGPEDISDVNINTIIVMNPIYKNEISLMLNNDNIDVIVINEILKNKEINMSEIEKFQKEVKNRVDSYRQDFELNDLSNKFFMDSLKKSYSYNFSWLGRPIIQYPQDMIALQEIIWDVKPDMIIETGIAHGGSLIFSASMLTLLEACGEIENGKVLGIDIDIREHNKKAIEEHPMSKKITMFEGSSIDSEIINRVHEFAKQGKKVLVCLDSNHTHEHVLAELKAYANLVSIGSYCCVFDTIIEDMPQDSFLDRPWDIGDNPKTAVWEYLKENDDFVIDKDIENKILITVAPDGYLKRIK